MNRAPSLRKPGLLPLIPGHFAEPRRDDASGVAQLSSHPGRILLAMAVSNRRGVLVPAGVARPAGRQHQHQPLVTQPQDITDMAGVPSADQAPGDGRRALSPGPASTSCHCQALRRIIPAIASRAKPCASRPQSGDGRPSTQVQSLVSGTIVTARHHTAGASRPPRHSSREHPGQHTTVNASIATATSGHA